MKELHHDVYFSNVYRDDVYSMFEGEQGYKGMDELTRMYNKAVLLTEVGRHQRGYTDNELYPYWFNRIWKSIIDTKNRGNIGAVFFEYSNEQWKDILQQTMGVVDPVVGYDSTGKSSITLNAFVLDQMQRIPIIFDAVKQGREPYTAYHFNANIWSLRGETPAVLGTTPTPPPPPTPSPTPNPPPTPTPSPTPNPPTDPRCGTGLAYCNDMIMGAVCYSTTQYVCANSKRLCPIGNDVCGSACFQSNLYQCCESTGQIYQKTQTLPANCGTTTPTPPPPTPTPTPTPPTGGICGALSTCGTQCYDANVYQCNTDAQGVKRLCPKGLSSCGAACYNSSQYKCCGTTLKQSFEMC